MPRGQYDRTKSKEQRAAEKKAAGKGAKLAAPAVTYPAPKPSKSFGAALSKKAASETAVKSVKPTFSPIDKSLLTKKLEEPSSGFVGFDLQVEINQVSSLITTLSSNRALLDNRNLSVTDALDDAISNAVDHLERLRTLLPHGIGQPGPEVAKMVTKDDLETAEQARISAEVEKRRIYKAETAPVVPSFPIPTPVPMPGTTAPQPPAFIPLAAPPVNVS